MSNKELVKVTDIPYEKGVFWFCTGIDGKVAVWKAVRGKKGNKDEENKESN